MPKYTQEPMAVFLYRLLAGIGLAISAILAAWSIHLASARIPAMREVLVDFDMTPPAAARLAFMAPWLPAAICSISFVLGVIAVFSIRRVALASSWVTAMLGLGTLVLFDNAISMSFSSLISSITGK